MILYNQNGLQNVYSRIMKKTELQKKFFRSRKKATTAKKKICGMIKIQQKYGLHF